MSGPSTTPGRWARWPRGAFAWPVLPRPCALCARWSHGALCTDCVARFVQNPPARCPRCALPLAAAAPCGACLRDPPPFDRCVAVADYAFPWDRLIAGLKFQDQPERARLLADLLHRAVLQAGGPAVQCVLPVPLSERRLAERGYNQAWELARRAARALGCRAEAQLLLRPLPGPTQAELNLAQRLRNLRGAYLLNPASRRSLHGQHVALVDDVMTTGTTLREAAATLRRAGAARIDAWALARTPAPGD